MSPGPSGALPRQEKEGGAGRQLFAGLLRQACVEPASHPPGSVTLGRTVPCVPYRHSRPTRPPAWSHRILSPSPVSLQHHRPDPWAAWFRVVGHSAWSGRAAHSHPSRSRRRPGTATQEPACDNRAQWTTAPSSHGAVTPTMTTHSVPPAGLTEAPQKPPGRLADSSRQITGYSSATFRNVTNDRI